MLYLSPTDSAVYVGINVDTQTFFTVIIPVSTKIKMFRCLLSRVLWGHKKHDRQIFRVLINESKVKGLKINSNKTKYMPITR